MTTDYEMQMLAKAQREGRWGFTVTGNTLTGDLLTTMVPVFGARSWVVQLNAWRYSSGTLQPTSNSVDPDGQTAAFLRAKVVFGTDSAYETVLLDYPVRGCTFPVQGSLVRLSFLPPTSQISFGAQFTTPILSGTISPGNTGRAAVDSLGPTFTTQIGSIGKVGDPNNTVIVNLPARACAYRVMYQAESIAPVALNIVQTTGQGANVELAWDYGQITAGSGEPLYDTNTNSISAFRIRDPIPLIPMANSLTIRNLDAVVVSALTVQFLLDLG